MAENLLYCIHFPYGDTPGQFRPYFAKGDNFCRQEVAPLVFENLIMGDPSLENLLQREQISFKISQQ